MKIKLSLFALIFFSIIFGLYSPIACFAEKISGLDNYSQNEILIKFKKSFLKNKTEKSFQDFAVSHNLIFENNKNFCTKNCYYLFKLENGNTINNAIADLNLSKFVYDVQPNYYFESTKKPSKKNKTGNQITNDKYIKREWWAFNSGIIGMPGADLGLTALWGSEQKNWINVAVGIIDSGINNKHTDLKANLVNGYNFVHGGSKPKDREGHGSFIAGLIASEVNNKKGVAGISSQNHIKIMPLKFDFSTEEAVSAINFASQKGVRILNMSWGTDEYDQALYEAIKNFNGVVVAAAGNDSLEHNLDHHFYPCDFDLDNIVCVGASNENDLLASYSDWGKTVDILAPGGDGSPLISLDQKTNNYITGVGTSFSAAFVSGSAAIILSSNPSISNSEIITKILDSSRKKDYLTDKVTSGGILDIGKIAQ